MACQRSQAPSLLPREGLLLPRPCQPSCFQSCSRLCLPAVLSPCPQPRLPQAPPPARGHVPGSPRRRFLPASLGGRPAHLAASMGGRGEVAQTRWSQAPAEPRCGRGRGGGVPSFPLGLS